MSSEAITGSQRGRLFLLPSTLGESASIETIPALALSALHRLEHLAVESPKQARRFLRAAGLRLSDKSVRFYVLDEHTPDSALAELLAVPLSGKDLGLLSDAGCPAIADPGAKLVRLAHEHGIELMPMVGPCSITLALMGSGLNGQRFAFHGYLPVESQARARALRALEAEARSRDQTQIMIETPYRNRRLLDAILEVCALSSLLCIATDLTLPTQYIATRTIAAWRLEPPDLDRRPTVFLLSAQR